MEQELHEKECLNCGELFKTKRVDAKFCKMKCRTQFHYNSKGKGELTKQVLNKPVVIPGPNFREASDSVDRDVAFAIDFFKSNGLSEELCTKFMESHKKSEDLDYPMFSFNIGLIVAKCGANLGSLKALLEKWYLE